MDVSNCYVIDVLKTFRCQPCDDKNVPGSPRGLIYAVITPLFVLIAFRTLRKRVDFLGSRIARLFRYLSISVEKQLIVQRLG